MPMAYEELIEKLRKKGWSNRDIVATIQIMEKIQQEEKRKKKGKESRQPCMNRTDVKACNSKAQPCGNSNVKDKKKMF